MKLSKELLNKIINWLENSPVEFYWNRSAELIDSQIEKIIEDGWDGFYEVADELREHNMDYVFFLEQEKLHEAFKFFECEIEEEWEHYNESLPEGERSDSDLEEVFDEIAKEEELLYHVFVNENLTELVRRTEAKINLYLPFDFSSSHPQGYNDDCNWLGILNINPREYAESFFCKETEQEDIEDYPDFYFRNGKEKVDITSLISEQTNAFYGGTLCVLCDIDLMDYLKNFTKNNKSIVIPSGSTMGIVDHAYGSGGPFEINVVDDIVVPYGEYDIECDSTKKYSVEKIYGMCESAWDSNVYLYDEKDVTNSPVSA